MASIRKRLAKGCVTYSYQVQIRRTGIPSFTLSFATYEAAFEWVEKNEELYIRNHEPYLKKYAGNYVGTRLHLLRKRHFKKRELYKDKAK